MPTIAVNRKAAFEYEILEKFEAGIELTGHETKSIKMGRVNIAGARAIIRNNEAFILGMDIPSFQPKNAPKEHKPDRTRKLLLKKNEIKYMIGKIQSGFSLIPLKVFEIRHFLKIEIGLARGLKKHDKREVIRKKESRKEIEKYR